MSDNGKPTQSTRRRYLAATTTVLTGGAIAGCLSNGGSPDDLQTSYQCELVERESVDDLAPPSEGASDPDVTIDVFSDFSCPHCRDFALNTLPELRADYVESDAIAARIRHFDYPIPISDWSRPIANAARSVQDSMGDEAFFSFSEMLYESQDNYSWEVVGNAVEEIGADPCAVLTDGHSERYDGVITSNKKTGSDRGVSATPGVFVGETLIRPEESWYNAISTEIENQL